LVVLRLKNKAPLNNIKMDIECNINYFFSSFLELIMRELENDDKNSDSTNHKITNFINFINNNGDILLENNEHLRNYASIFLLAKSNHNIFGKNEYCFLTDIEKENARKYGSRQKYNRIPMEHHIHDSVNRIEAQDIPMLVRFFSKNIELFEELNKNIHLIV
jgi:hypothetical protein